jgi:1-acyl-sn-glycerol-3-phosphate acyltransferase
VPVAIEYADRADAWVGDGSFLGHFLTCFRKRRVEVSIAFGPTLRAAEVDDLKGRAESWIRARLEEFGARSAPERARLDSLTGPQRGRAASATFA